MLANNLVGIDISCRSGVMSNPKPYKLNTISYTSPPLVYHVGLSCTLAAHAVGLMVGGSVHTKYGLHAQGVFVSPDA